MTFHTIHQPSVGADLSCPIGINLTQSSSYSVGARAEGSGGEGLYGRPRPIPLAHTLGEHDRPPPAGDHKGPPNLPSPPSPLRITRTHLVSLMPIGADLSAIRKEMRKQPCKVCLTNIWR